VARLEGALVEAGKSIGLPVSMSFGTVVTDWHGLEDARELLERADALMYEDKRARRRAMRDAGPQRPAAAGPGGALPPEPQDGLRGPDAEL
jgi:hypothetical protein